MFTVMALLGGARSRLLALVLLLAAVFVLANLVFNLQNLALAPDVRPGFGEEGPTGGGQFELGIPWSVLRILLISFLLMLVTFIVGGILYLKSKGKGIHFPLHELIGGLGILIAFLVLYLVLMNLGGPTATLEGERELGFPADTEGGVPGLPISSAAPIGLIFLGVAFGVVLAGVLLSRWLSQRNAAARIEQTAEEARRKAALYIKDAIYRLDIGEDVRSVILRCYDEMTQLFRDKGLKYGKDLTARELESLAKRKLRLSDASAVKLRELFEEARYSIHAMSEMSKEVAIGCLNSVKESLDVLKSPHAQAGV